MHSVSVKLKKVFNRYQSRKGVLNNSFVPLYLFYECSACVFNTITNIEIGIDVNSGDNPAVY